MTAPAPEGRALRGAVALILIGLILGPIAAGLWESGRAALGILPALASNSPREGNRQPRASPLPESNRRRRLRVTRAPLAGVC